MFDLCNKASFSSLSDWFEEIKHYAQPEVIIFLVGPTLPSPPLLSSLLLQGTKSDLAESDREVSHDEATVRLFLVSSG